MTSADICRDVSGHLKQERLVKGILVISAAVAYSTFISIILSL